MNDCRQQSLDLGVFYRRSFVGMLFAAAISVSGCGGGKGAPPPEGQLHIENVAKWFQVYREFNGRKAPPNEAAFIAFIEKQTKDRGVVIDFQEMLTSPRDGQKYVIPYGKPTSGNPERNVAAYESEGYDGKKLVAFESAWSQEVDEAKLQEILAGSGK